MNVFVATNKKDVEKIVGSSSSSSDCNSNNNKSFYVHWLVKGATKEMTHMKPFVIVA